jgi:N4-gp56 family major capsid protein
MPTVKSTGLLTNISPAPAFDNTFYSRELLLNAKYKDIHGRWADSVNLPQKKGKTILFRRYAHLAMPLAPLAEGIPPTGKVPSLADYTATLNQFGDFIALTDLAEMVGIDEFQRHWAALLGEQAGYTMDAIDRDVAAAGSSIIYSNGTDRTHVLSLVDAKDLDLVIRALSNKGAEKLLAGNAGSQNVGSSPIMPAYPAVTMPDVMHDIQNIDGFKWASDYKGAAEGEVGRYKQLAFFEAPDPSELGAGGKKYAGGGASSTAVKNTAGTADVYTILVFAKRGFTRVPVNGGSTKTYRKGLGSAGTSDPIDQLQTMGWKNTSARLITNQNWMHRIECAVSD